MIELGCIDPDVPDAACAAYAQVVEKLTRVPLASVRPGLDKLVTRRQPAVPGSMGIKALQQGLQAIGFLPAGKDDGIFGYRTQSALRLFQEYVRSVEKLACMPDGRFGPQTQAHLQRWLDQRLVSSWATAMTAWRAGTPLSDNHTQWLQWLEAVKQKHLAAPSPALRKVNEFPAATDTRKPANWDFSAASDIHLVGIRRKEFTGSFDDIFVLLLKGLVFKFQGSTEPGSSSHPEGPPYLVPGQHDYHFGWHRSTYLALRPAGAGVLVIRSGADKALGAADLNKGLEPNATINIHWGGRGMDGQVNNWSEGCQVINGTLYIDPDNQLVNCAGFAATASTDPTVKPQKTRGAYNVLLDLVTTLGPDNGAAAVKYTLVEEADVALAPALAHTLADARQQVGELLSH